MGLFPVRPLSGAIVAASMVVACETVPYTGRSPRPAMTLTPRGTCG
jgi:hypothetical protein